MALVYHLTFDDVSEDNFRYIYHSIWCTLKMQDTTLEGCLQPPNSQPFPAFQSRDLDMIRHP